jgi:hypothetical protein
MISNPDKQALLKAATSDSSMGGSSGLTLIEDGASAEVILDWKGDPMHISPGDKLPFKFL